VSTVDDDVEFWDSRYRAGRMPWDLVGVPNALTRWLSTFPSPGRALIPGCGSGYEVQAFHDANWDVMAIDYAPAAVARARTGLGALGDKVLLADFFAHDFGEEKFDVIYERTFLCSLPPERWPAYACRMAELLVDRGELVGIFFYGDADKPPPYPLTEETAQRTLGERFIRTVDETVTDSLLLFAGRERWQIWQNRDATI
jgi:hypothetical protein